MEIKTVCSSCNSDLTHTASVEPNGNVVLDIDFCDKCGNDRYEEGIKYGQTEGP